MKKSTIVALTLITMGFIFEYFHLMTDIQIIEIKFWFMGMICIIAGFISLWTGTILPALNGDKKQQEK